MNCRKAQSQFDDLSVGRLPEPLAAALRQHLDDCTDCRVAHQRASRLQRLLALKQHERPATEYFDGFLAEFHRRLDVEMQPRPSVWERLAGAWRVEPVRGWRFGFAGALGMTVAAVVLWFSVRPANQTVATARPDLLPVGPTPTLFSASVPAVQAVPLTIAAPLPSLPRESWGRLQPEMAGNPAGSATSVMSISAVADRSNESLAPRYVLDRVTVSPASYEVANVHF